MSSYFGMVQLLAPDSWRCAHRVDAWFRLSIGDNKKCTENWVLTRKRWLVWVISIAVVRHRLTHIKGWGPWLLRFCKKWCCCTLARNAVVRFPHTQTGIDGRALTRFQDTVPMRKLIGKTRVSTRRPSLVFGSRSTETWRRRGFHNGNSTSGESEERCL